ncbi:hypothetical protein [Paenibacillus pini]|uniref:Uncharacterized protein n=1 Tax=Paenibacillus pini JCM 16418 TaxID=1236976 RepID=W7YPJ2_9BACL|nr:hypothetical protein [Paenibacillus pini]GAF10377.1 hypothetical protein JCM16418_4564 [Paenibacillus pini JCM 16418]
MKDDRCQNNCCEAGSCFSSLKMEAVYHPLHVEQATAAGDLYGGDEEMPSKQRRLLELLDNAESARACSLPEMASLVEMAITGTITKEEALLSLDAVSIGDVCKEAAKFQKKMNYRDFLTAPETLLGWSDEVRSLRVFIEEGKCSRQSSRGLKGSAGLMLLREEEWLEYGEGRDLYEAWLSQDAIGEVQKRDAIEGRLLHRWKLRWEGIFHSAEGQFVTAAMIHRTTEVEPGSIRLHRLRDIQLEALFRAMLSYETEPQQHNQTEPRIDLLIPYPANGESFQMMHDFIDRVAEETLCAQQRFVHYRVGVLLDENSKPEVALEVARYADVIVMNLADERLLALQQMIRPIRGIKPAIRICAAGTLGMSSLPAIYRMELSEVSCTSAEADSIRIAAAQWELLDQMQEAIDPTTSSVRL